MAKVQQHLDTDALAKVEVPCKLRVASVILEPRDKSFDEADLIRGVEPQHAGLVLNASLDKYW